MVASVVQSIDWGLAARTWRYALAFLNSSFTTAVAGSLGGALAGALAAQRIARRNATVDALVAYVRDSNAAITLTLGVANSMVGLKRQFVMPLVADFSELTGRYQRYLRELPTAGTHTEPFHFGPDMQMIDPPETSIDDLRDLILRIAGTDPVAWTVFHTLRQVVLTASRMMQQRNEILERMRTATREEASDMVSLYLGVRRSDGNIDARHAQLVELLPRQVDDALGFAKVLAEHISLHASEEVKLLGRGAPRVRGTDFRHAEALGVMPDMAEYYAMVDSVGGKRLR